MEKCIQCNVYYTHDKRRDGDVRIVEILPGLWRFDVRCVIGKIKYNIIMSL